MRPVRTVGAVGGVVRVVRVVGPEMRVVHGVLHRCQRVTGQKRIVLAGVADWLGLHPIPWR